MSVFNGKWKLVSSGNELKFFKAMGYSDEFIKDALPYSDPKNNVQEEYIISDTEMTSVIYMKGEKKYSQTVKRGKDIPFTDLAGRDSKITNKIEGNTMTTIQDFGSVTATYVITVDKDNMTQEFSCSAGGGSTRELKKV